MKLTPIDIRQQQFRRSFRGLDAREVDNFLKIISDQLEALIGENNRLREELARSAHVIEEYRERERALKETMITAQKITDDLKESARKEAEIILSEAELQAERIVSAANQRLIKVIEDINEAKRQREQLHANLAAIIQAHRRLLKEIDEEKTEKLFLTCEQLRQRRSQFHAAIREVLEAQANLLGLDRDQEIEDLRQEGERLQLLRSNLLSRMQGEIDTHGKLLAAREEAEARAGSPLEKTQIRILPAADKAPAPAAPVPLRQSRENTDDGAAGTA